MSALEYVRPSSLVEACQLLSSGDGPNCALAGGTDLLVNLKSGRIHPRRLISLRDIQRLRFIRSEASEVVVGSMTTISALAEDSIVRKWFPDMVQAAQSIGSSQIRNRATVGGNLCNAAPSADLAPVLLAHEALLAITRGSIERVVPACDFFVGPGRTILEPGEVLTEIRIRKPERPFSAIYLKARRSSMDIALVGVDLFLTFEPEGHKCKGIALALGAVAPTPIRIRNPDNPINGLELDGCRIEQLVQAALEQSRPITDLRATAEYRRILIGTLVRRALAAANAFRGGPDA